MNPIVYGLVDPIAPGHVRYVGMAFRRSRPTSHAKEARRNPKPTHKLNWIRSLQAEGRDPAVLVLEELPEGAAKTFVGFVESCYIKSLRNIGHDLTNGTDGGDGLINPTPEVRARISAGTKKGQTPKARLLMKEAALRRFAVPENRAERSRSAKAATTESTREKISNAGKHRSCSIETREKMRLSHLGRKYKKRLLS